MDIENALFSMIRGFFFHDDVFFNVMGPLNGLVFHFNAMEIAYILDRFTVVIRYFLTDFLIDVDFNAMVRHFIS